MGFLSCEGIDSFIDGQGLRFRRDEVQGLVKRFREVASQAADLSLSNLISLREAARLFVGRRGIVDVIQAIFAGKIPLFQPRSANAKLSEYVVFRHDLVPYHPAKHVAAVPIGMWTHGTAADFLGCTIEVVRNLIRTGHLVEDVVRGSHGLHFLSTSEIERFKGSYIGLSQVARGLNVHSRTLLAAMPPDGEELIRIQLPGKGYKIFVSRKTLLFRERLIDSDEPASLRDFSRTDPAK